MEVRTFPALSDDDEPFVERLGAGLGDRPARVLAYLLLRAERDGVGDEPATLLTVQVGTGLGRNAVTDALSSLEDRGLVTATTVQDETRGRPPQAWEVAYGPASAPGRVYDRHADRLLDRARTAFDVGDESAESAQFSDSDDADRDDDADREFTVGLNWTPNGLHLPLFAAAGRDEYADRGLSVDFAEHRGSSASLAAVASGEADVGVAGAVSLVEARRRGEPVVPLALLFQRAMTVLYAERDRFDGGLESVEQLRGRRVGMPVESEAGLLGRLFLAQSGVLADVELVDIAGEERRALLDGEADAVTGSFSDPRELREDGVRTDSLRVADQFPICGPSLVATEGALRRRRGPLAEFLAATAAGWAAAVSRPYEVSTGSGIIFDDDERRTFERAVGEFGANDAVCEHGWGWQDRETWDRLETALSVADLDADE
ncbi:MULTISPECIES: ABC transporter substrate-binding protein [Halorussus]|uniref:ABC transporter substrate-binding protein n=1 Tax=Halorussus TaxID=1070314 RepID=UPI000E215A6E|nr:MULTISPECIES: ABC transporter substrate-binding protein [Halorussus]NHN59857.1 ABC transporter substrate-binding protein [Halorussus sp. JP-T4]